MKLTIDQLKALGYEELMPGHWHRRDGALAVTAPTKPSPPPKPPKRIRQSANPLLNRLETEWHQELLKSYIPETIFAQAVRFKLANGVWYKPDFIVFGYLGLYAFECKGPHAFRGGFENLKVAAHAYRQIKWSLVWKANGQWCEQVVLP